MSIIKSNNTKFFREMVNKVLFTFALLITFFTNVATAQVGYAELKDGTLTFKYGDKPEGAFDIIIVGEYQTPRWFKLITSITKVVFDDSFAAYHPTSCRMWFSNCSNLTEIVGINNFSTDKVTDMEKMFYGCSSLTTLDLSGLDTKNVTKMNNMFQGCSSLISLDLSGFDTQNVTDMVQMFYDCSSLTSLDLSGFDTKNVKNMVAMFENCSSLISLDLSGFDTQNVTNMKFMFCECKSLTNLDVSGFDTQNVTDMYFMFYCCSSLSSLDVSGFNTKNVKNMGAMFSNCSALTTLDVSGFDTKNVKYMGDMFKDCEKLGYIIVGEGWSTSLVEQSNNMFSGCTHLHGSKGTAYNADYTDATYARVDGGTETPGYLTIKAVSIEISTTPKTEYTEGDDFVADNGKLTVKYTDNSTEIINLSAATITGYNKTKPGVQTLKIEYQGVETTLQVIVKSKMPTPVSDISNNQNDINVWCFNHTIFIENAPDTEYKIIDTNGRVITTSTTKSSKEEIKINKSGVLIVLIGNTAYKVVN